MTVIAGWLTNRGDPAGGQTRAGTRLLALGAGYPTAATAVRSGLLPGGSPCQVTGSGMTVTVAIGRGMMQGSAAAGAYPVAVTAPDAVVVTNGDPSNPRRDIVGIRVYDSLVDGSGFYKAQVEILQGAAAPSPVDPTPPVGAVWLPLARLRIPAGASAGSPPTWGSIIDDLRTYTVGPGGVLPDPANTAVGAYTDQVRMRSNRLERWSGSAWVECDLPSAITADAYADWIPTWSSSLGSVAIADGYMYGKSHRVARMANGYLKFKIGPSTNVGSAGGQWRWTIPYAARVFIDTDDVTVGSARAFRPGISNYIGVVMLNRPGGYFYIAGNAANAWGNGTGPWPSTPTNGDIVTFQYSYETAA
ncbi:hypothetical protein [Yinghuangia soli]|uniref:Uncharacterized protein n=1 Tax=Yinghuangia soli TaxID=2908204 RepID=A0AA41Q697_9ACTN|nr:hypothetical protein [Yinghuangia soli]MCF2531755.1 hypothetical protein [Yinghuangia soli]